MFSNLEYPKAFYSFLSKYGAMFILTDKMPQNTMLPLKIAEIICTFVLYYEASRDSGFCVLEVSYDLAWGLAHRKAKRSISFIVQCPAPESMTPGF